MIERNELDLEAAQLAISEPVLYAAFEKLVPQVLLEPMLSRATELDTCAKRVAWVQTQMAHTRGAAQATQPGGTPEAPYAGPPSS